MYPSYLTSRSVIQVKNPFEKSIEFQQTSATGRPANVNRLDPASQSGFPRVCLSQRSIQSRPSQQICTDHARSDGQSLFLVVGQFYLACQTITSNSALTSISCSAQLCDLDMSCSNALLSIRRRPFVCLPVATQLLLWATREVSILRDSRTLWAETPILAMSSSVCPICVLSV